MRIVYGLLAALAVMVAGFWPSFFSNPAQNDALHTIHGVLASGWMLILIVQAFLMARGQVTLHHLIGRASMAWAVALFITAVMIMQFGVAATGERSLPLPWRPILTWIDIPSLLMFAGFYIAAIVCAFQRRSELHYRFMLCTVIVIFSPALGRLLAPAFHGLIPALHPTFWTIEAVCVALIVYDYLAYKRTWPPYWIALVGQVLIQWTMFSAPKIPAFMNIMRSMGLPSQ
ncbi:hypothetical protein [Asticcacaulis benevestitus]|uniref:DUF2306 domain-containing protein n=1 Tax=Asticcacaulis benevestitus DSM 16100 = ATCC BAA-896 TaxID=1121022 RepID=V4PNE8_9CAUL|nr:hypothetical protein [Asticcacaulis benevestitus]ESQ87010.1 hypothetical protein ABENE_17425 [Asticcacaulis benevestitus DSM 16100 = ATCC BAA-896]